MKKSHLKFSVRRLTTCAAIVLAGMLASCSNEGNDPEQPVAGNTETLKLISGAKQAGRVQNFVETKANKSMKLTLMAAITAPEDRADLNWSATAIDFNGAKAYVTWHSNKQAKTPAKEWGGAVDVIENGKINVTAESKLLKFNHVLYDNGKLFLAATSATDAGVVGRIDVTGEGVEPTLEYIGFPGVSVNAVAKNGDEMIAVSGYKGCYGTFAPTADAQLYYYGDDAEKQKENVVTTLADYTENFGGKYVTTDENGVAYVLHNTENATITKVGGESVELGVGLVSAVKVAETYDPITEEWVPASAGQNYYGKHVLAVRNGIAYVACGGNGLVVYDLKEGKRLCENDKLIKAKTTGVCADDKYVYLATEIGLQVYDWVNDEFHRYAFEVASYDETGNPTSTDSPVAGTDERHSPNFVAVNPTTGEIYVAYGQSGVRVYKLAE